MNALSDYKIIPSVGEDVDFIFSLFDHAIAYQGKNGFDVWPQFSRQLIETEIAEERNWKLMEGDTIACMFSVLYSDPVIWKERDKDPAVYLHRIVINPLCKGKGMMELIKQWAIQHARQKHKKFIRMDTWGNNENLRNYYIRCGFHYIGQQYLEAVNGLPAHYGGAVLSLFEIDVDREPQ